MAQVAQIAVYGTDGNKTGEVVALPEVFRAPVRPDLVEFVHVNIRKNSRQPYGVKCHFGPTGIVAGHQHSAHSWGTGRAVSRIPRVSGGGTHRAGQGAFGNMCRSGRMAFPTKVWRKWHRKVNLKQRRYAVASAIAASASAPLVMARGHRIEMVPEIPLIVDFDEMLKTSEAFKMLKACGLGEELERCHKAKIRIGKGKYGGGRKRRVGPLIVYLGDHLSYRGFRNIPGVHSCHVERLNLLKLAPGTHLGRLIVWQKKAIEALPAVYAKKAKTGFPLPVCIMQHAEVTGNLRKRSLPSSLTAVFSQIVHAESIQKELRSQRPHKKGRHKKRKLTKPKNAKRLYADKEDEQE